MNNELKLLKGFRDLRQLGENIAHMDPGITKDALAEVCTAIRDAYDAIEKKHGRAAAEFAWKERHDEVWPVTATAP